MKYYNIPTEVRLDIERIVRRYPRNKAKLDSLYEDVVLATHPAPTEGNTTSENKPQSVTEGKALQLMNPYYDRLKKEVYAVEQAVKGLDKNKLDIIRIRYWQQDKKTAFKSIDVPYESTTMRFVARKVLYDVGVNMGLIKGE